MCQAEAPPGTLQHFLIKKITLEKHHFTFIIGLPKDSITHYLLYIGRNMFAMLCNFHPSYSHRFISNHPSHLHSIISIHSSHPHMFISILPSHPHLSFITNSLSMIWILTPDISYWRWVVNPNSPHWFSIVYPIYSHWFNFIQSSDVHEIGWFYLSTSLSGDLKYQGLNYLNSRRDLFYLFEAWFVTSCLYDIKIMKLSMFIIYET